MILLTVPIFFPLIVHMGLDPIWFGVLIVVVVEIGLISPPVGMNLFVLNTLLPQVPTRRSSTACCPSWRPTACAWRSSFPSRSSRSTSRA